jgi:large subunit ribosomal protein L33
MGNDARPPVPFRRRAAPQPFDCWPNGWYYNTYAAGFYGRRSNRRDKPDRRARFVGRVSKGGATMRVVITLECTETGDRNYTTTKNKKTHPQRLELKKYSPRLKRHTLHREVR